jgi:hypothetical protein
MLRENRRIARAPLEAAARRTTHNYVELEMAAANVVGVWSITNAPNLSTNRERRTEKREREEERIVHVRTTL